MKSPLVSVIICVYNGEKYLYEALCSVADSTLSDFEVIVIDDGSTDKSLSIIKEFVARDNRYKFFQRVNGGLASSRNFAFSKSRGQWLAILDQDDLMYANRLNDQLDLCRQEHTLFCFGDTDYIDSLGTITGSHLSRYRLPVSPLRSDMAGNLLLKKGCFIDSESWFMHTSLFEKAGPLDEMLTYACDYEYFIRLSKYSDFSYLNKKVGAWRVHLNQQTSVNSRRFSEISLVYMRFIRQSFMSPDMAFWWIIRFSMLSIRSWLIRR